MTATVIRGDARRLPFDDETVDLICTSPPYWNLRDYKKGDGQSLPGQIGAEPSWQEYIDNLAECTAEWERVLKPGGSMFVVLGDKYSDRGHGPHRGRGTGRAPQGTGLRQSRGPREKSLLGLPWRYAFACADTLGLTIRAEIIWDKVNPLPESVTDRVRRGHETIFHLVKQRHYYTAVDAIREPHEMRPQRRPGGRPVDLIPRQGQPRQSWPTAERDEVGVDGHPLGKLPGTVWRIPSAPLNIPARIGHARCCAGRKKPGCTQGLDHHAAYPPALAKKIILGWSPPGICTKCGDGRFPVHDGTEKVLHRPNGLDRITGLDPRDSRWGEKSDIGNVRTVHKITGYACSCTPCTDYPERRRRSVTQDRALARGDDDNDARAAATGSRHHGDGWPAQLPVREYHFDLWTPAPTTPAIVADPFGGTGTTPMTADLLGRAGFAVELSDGYCGLAQWRISDPGERARALEVPKPPPVADGQLSFEELVS